MRLLSESKLHFYWSCLDCYNEVKQTPMTMETDGIPFCQDCRVQMAFISTWYDDEVQNV